MRTGTTSFGPMYPIMPHMREPFLNAEHSLLFSPGRPPADRPLLAGADRQRARRNVFAHRRPAADIRACADRDRCNQLRIAADERAFFDDGLVFPLAVVVAGDG